MTLQEATDRLKIMVVATGDPTVPDGEITLLLSGAQTGTDTWDLARAAAEGWRWKAGKVAERVDVGDEAATLKRSQLYDHCIAQARVYDAAAEGSGRLDSTGRPLARFAC